jgi:hypothetical protein
VTADHGGSWQVEADNPFSSSSRIFGFALRNWGRGFHESEKITQFYSVLVGFTQFWCGVRGGFGFLIEFGEKAFSFDCQRCVNPYRFR